MKTLRYTGRPGFTLIELLTVLTLLSVLTTLGVTMFFRVSDLWRTTSIRTDLGHQAQSALDILYNDMSQVLSAKHNGAVIHGEQRGVEFSAPGMDYFRVQVADDTLTLPVGYPNYLTGARERVRVRYAVNRDGLSHRLTREVLPLHGEIPPETAPRGTVVAEGVVGFRVEFWDGAQWLPQWPPAEAATATPLKIRVSLTIHDIDRPYEQISRQAVYTVQVE